MSYYILIFVDSENQDIVGPAVGATIGVLAVFILVVLATVSVIVFISR